MGVRQSRQLYAFQPLPWPEALNAFRLIDQICGIATTYATQHLQQHAFPVLDKVAEIQRLPQQWEVFEGDFESLRGSHMVQLATELHKALDGLEGYKYDLGTLAEKRLICRSTRKAADKVLSILQGVQEVHAAFHYAFELALYASLRETNGTATLRNGAAAARAALQSPSSVTYSQSARTVSLAADTTGGGASSRGGAAGGGGGVVLRSRGLPPPPPQAPPSSVAPSRLDFDNVDGGAGRGGSGGGAGSSAVQWSSGGGAAAASPAAAATAPAPASASVARSVPAAVAPSAAATPATPAATVPVPAAAAAVVAAAAVPGSSGDQQYVVVYLPEGPKGGPRAILVPSASLQPAPPTPSPSSGGAGPAASGLAGLMAASSVPRMVPQPTHGSAVHFANPLHQTASHAAWQSTYGGGSATGAGFRSSLGGAKRSSGGGSATGRGLASGAFDPAHVASSGILRNASHAPTTPPYAQYSRSVSMTHGPSTAPPSYKYYTGPPPPPQPAPTFASSPVLYPPPTLSPPSSGPIAWQQPVPTYATPSPFAGAAPIRSSSPPPVDLSSYLSPARSFSGGAMGWAGGAVPWPAATSPGGSPPGSPGLLSPTATLTHAGSNGTDVVVVQPFTMRSTATGEIVLQPQPQQPQPLIMQVTQPAYESQSMSAAATAAVSYPGGTGAGKAYGNGADTTLGQHSTYTYVASQSEPRQIRAVNSGSGAYLTPYTGPGSTAAMYGTGGLQEGDGADAWRPSSAASNGRRSGGRARSSRRPQSGGGTAQLLSQLRTMTSADVRQGVSWADGDEEDEPYTFVGEAGGALSAAAALAPRAGPDVLYSGLAPGVTEHVTVQAGPLSYERLASLAGLERKGGTGAGTAAGAKGFVLPDEARLRRAEELVAAAEAGEWGAVVELAGSVRRGWWGDGRDAAVARGLLMQAAMSGGSLDAHAALGEMAEAGEGLPGGRPDPAAAARHYAAAAAGGHRDATTAYAYLLERGLGVPRDEPRAAQLYAAAAQRGCPTASNNLAKMILDGRGGIAAAATAASGTGSTSRSSRAVQEGRDGEGAGSPTALAMALFKRSARSGSAAAAFNVGMCHLQQLRKQQQQQVGSKGDGAGDGTADGEVPYDEREALRWFGEAAAKGHARAALKAGQLHLQRERAAAAVEAFATAALNAAAAGQGGAGAKDATAGGGGGGRDAESEALWCLAQMAERQAGVLEERAVMAGLEGGGGGGGGGGGKEQQEGGLGGRGSGDGSEDRRVMRGGSGLLGSGNGRSRKRMGLEHKNDLATAFVDGGGDGGGELGVRSDGSGSGKGVPGSGAEAAGAGVGGGEEGRMVRQLLASLADAGKGGSGVGVGGAGRGGVLANGEVFSSDPRDAAAVAFANQLCRLDFGVCCRPAGPLPLGALLAGGGTATASKGSRGTAKGEGEPRDGADVDRLRVYGLKRLRRQARELMAAGGGSVAAQQDDGDGSEASSLGGAVAGGAAVASALARLDLQLKPAAERAAVARRAAADLMAAAAVRGHPAAQHWLAGWQWAAGQRAAAVALWENAGAAGYGAALMALGQLAEAGQEAADGQAARGPDLAAAARHYLRAQEAGAEGAIPAMRRVQALLQRHVALQGRLEAVAALRGP